MTRDIKFRGMPSKELLTEEETNAAAEEMAKQDTGFVDAHGEPIRVGDGLRPVAKKGFCIVDKN